MSEFAEYLEDDFQGGPAPWDDDLSEPNPAPASTSPDPDESGPMFWSKAQRHTAHGLWSFNVMADQRCSRRALVVAWALSFYFNAQDGKAWPKKATLAKRVGLSESSVASALGDLEKYGHISRTTEIRNKKRVRIILPMWNRGVGNQPKRAARGGVPKGVDPKFRSLERPMSDT